MTPHPLRLRCVTVATCLALVAAIGAFVAAYPILGNYFLPDDFGSFYEVANFGPREFLVAPAAGHMLVARHAALYVLFLLFRLESTGYFAVALATHIVNVLLLYALVRRLTGSYYLACFGALLFGVCPANAGTLGWFAVYGQAMAATFTLAALLLLVARGNDERPLGTAAAVWVALCMLVASQSFGTGAAAALVLPVVAVLLRPSVLHTRGPALVLCAVPVLVRGAWFLMHAVQTRLNPLPPAIKLRILEGLVSPDDNAAFMLGHISALGVVSLIAGGAYPLASYPNATSTAVVATFAIGVVWALVRGSNRSRRVLLAFLVLALASYASIAAARGATFAYLRPDDLMRSFTAATRYHYLAQVSITVIACLVLAEAASRFEWGPATSGLILGLWGIWAMAGTVLSPPIDHFDERRALVAHVHERILQQVREHPPGSTMCLRNEAAGLQSAFPGSVGVFMLLYPDNELEGRRVYFVSSDPKLLARREQGGRLARLLLPASACPP